MESSKESVATQAEKASLGSSKGDLVAQVVKAALGGGDSAGSKATGFGVMLAAIFLILEWQGGAVRSEQDQIRKDIEHTREQIVVEMGVRRDALQNVLERNDTDMRHEIGDLRQFLKIEHDRCDDRINKIISHDEQMQKQINELSEVIEKELRAHMKVIEDQQRHINGLMKEGK